MKKLLSISAISIIFTIITLVISSPKLEEMSIFNYLFSVVVLPIIYILVFSIISTVVANIEFKSSLLGNAVISFINALIITVTSVILVTEEVINKIISNTSVGEGVEMSIGAGSAGDNLQSFILFIAVAGISTFIGSKLRKTEKSY